MKRLTTTLAQRPHLVSTLVVGISAIIGAGLFVPLLYLPSLLVSFRGVHTSRQGEPTTSQFMFDLGWIVATFILASIATALLASRQLKRRQLPFAKVPWYILAVGYAVVLFMVADFLPV